jgi:hypothetical protein
LYFISKVKRISEGHLQPSEHEPAKELKNTFRCFSREELIRANEVGGSALETRPLDLFGNQVQQPAKLPKILRGRAAYEIGSNGTQPMPWA